MYFSSNEIATDRPLLQKKMERSVTIEMRDRICKTYEKVIADINSPKGEIKILSRTTFNISRTVTKKDIYAAVAVESGTGCSERTAEKYIKEYLKEKRKSTPQS